MKRKLRKEVYNLQTSKDSNWILNKSFEYSDNDGDFCAFMEHSGLLDRISLVRISHH